MHGLRPKLALAFAGVLIIMLMVSGLSLWVLNQYSRTLDRFLFENYRSVGYAQNMKDAVDELDHAAALAMRGDFPAARRLRDESVEIFEKNLSDELKNITLPGEDDAAKALREEWIGYRAVLDNVLNAALPESARNYDNELADRARAVKQRAQVVAQMNLENMVMEDGEIKTTAANTQASMIVLLVVGIALAVVFVAVSSRSLLLPLRSLIVSAREIERGNLDLIVKTRSRDEVGQLAEAFNAMAAKLREFRRSDRAKILRTQQTTQLAVDSLPDAVALVSAGGQVELANQTARRLFGLAPGETLDASRTPRLGEIYREARDSGRSVGPGGYDSVIQIFDNNGGERFFLPRAIPIVDAGEPIGVTVVLADITNLRKIDEMKSGLLSVVSHELKTPLTSIRMATHLLLEERVGPLTSKQFELLVAARDDADRLHHIVENLLDMARMESGRARLRLKPQPVDMLLHDMTAPHEAAFRDKGVSLNVDATPADGTKVMVDAERLEHVFSNLLTNALRYTPAGGTVKVTAAPDVEVNRICVTVQDTGIGVEPKDLGHIFERFYRVPGQKSSSGAGLGLAIAKDIVEAHGGTIGAQSESGQGLCVTFTLAANAPVAAGLVVTHHE